MVGFVGRVFADALRFALPLILGLGLMQVPALTHAYAVGLLQVAEATRADIEQRKAIARRYYRDMGASDDAVITALRRIEPSNAEGLEGSVDKARVLRAAHDRIQAEPSMLRPLTALLDLSEDGRGDKHAVLRTALETHVPQLILDMAGIGYMVAGIVLGALLARLLLVVLTWPASPRQQLAR